MPSHTTLWLRAKQSLAWLGVATLATIFLPAPLVNAADDGFKVQASPSPLVVTLAPGETQTDTISVHNFGTESETLLPSLSGFSIDNNSQNIRLNNTVPADVSGWVSFMQTSLSLAAGDSAPLDIVYHTPRDVGFSYSFAITLKRVQDQAAAPTATTPLDKQVVIFCLINIDRPDAKSELATTKFTTDRSHYNFLPATFELRVKNKGNVIGRPTGTIFIQRSLDSAKPIATLPINPENNYVLPGASRTFTEDWQAGFPLYITRTVNGKPEIHLSWDWKHAGDFRLGRYVAKAMVVYNNGQQDIPVLASTTFWVIPWWLLGLCLILAGMVAAGLIGWGLLIFKSTRQVRRYAQRTGKRQK